MRPFHSAYPSSESHQYRRWLCRFVACGCILMFTTLQAASTQKAFTLIELTDLALQKNPSTHVAWADIKNQAAALGIANSAYWPQIDADLMADYFVNQTSSSGGNETVILEEDPETADVSTTLVVNGGGNGGREAIITYNPSLGLNYLLLDFGTRAATAKAARYQLAAALFTHSTVVQQVILQVEQAYYQVLGQQALIKAQQESLHEAETSLQAANALHQQGLVTIGDVYQAKSALAQAQLTLQSTEGALTIAQGQLAHAAGLPVHTALPIVPIPERLPTQSIDKTIDNLLALAKQQRPDLQALRAQVQAATATLQAIQAEAWPTVELSADVGQTYPNNGAKSTQANALLTVNIPIFTGFLQTYRERQARAEQQRAAAEWDVLNNDIELQVWQAYFTLQTAEKAITRTQQLLDSSVEAAKQTYGQYRAGVGNILSVLTTQTTEANARVQFIQARLDWYIALAQLSHALGVLNS